MAILIIIAISIIIRLFYLQIIQHDFYQTKATLAHSGYTELPARRGDILIQDSHSGETFRIATNTTLDLLYADPILIKDANFITEQIAPLLFDIEESRKTEKERIAEVARTLPPEITEEEKNNLLREKSDDELRTDFKNDLLHKLQEKQRPAILLGENMDQTVLGEIQQANLVGVTVKDNNLYVYPPQITEHKHLAKFLADYVNIAPAALEKILHGENRYTVIKRKLKPDVSDKIKEIYAKNREQMVGIGLQEEYFRFYPERNFASQVIGYLDNSNTGQYGIERKFNTQLQGKKGVFQTQKDSIGRQITVGDSIIQPAVDGDNIVLTIDRSIQLQAEKILERKVPEFRADSGQILVIEVATGRILAMANYPTFDPNKYGDVLEKQEIPLSEDEIKKLVVTNEEQGIYYLPINDYTGERVTIFKELRKDGSTVYKKFINQVGPEVYHNKIVSWPYEPGSVFKAITMATGIDDGDITPQTTYNDTGPVEADFNKYTQKYDAIIKNATNHYYGLITMTQVLEKSLNTGTAFVAKKVGKNLFYSYIKKFGFGERTDIEFDNEEAGKISYYDGWTESELINHGFGQGITVTPLQMLNAYSALANKGVLMQPYIVDRIEHSDGKTTEFRPKVIHRVISEETANMVTAMLVSAVENGVAQPAKIKGHFVAGKTGTAQTYRGNTPLTGVGTTEATFTGFAPIDTPKFAILVKLDKPKTIEWADSTTGPMFKELTEFLFDYYNIPPDKKD